MSIVTLNTPIVPTKSPQFAELSCTSLKVNGVPITEGPHIRIPSGWIQTSSTVTINSLTGTLLTRTEPLVDASFTGSRLSLNLSGYIVIANAVPMLDIISVYCTYTKNDNPPVFLTPGFQTSNACYTSCSCHISGVTDDIFSAGDRLSLQIYAVSQIRNGLAIITNSSSWHGTIACQIVPPNQNLQNASNPASGGLHMACMAGMVGMSVAGFR